MSSNRGRAPRSAVQFGDKASRRTAAAARKEIKEQFKRIGVTQGPKAAPTKAPSRRWLWGPFGLSAADWALGWATGHFGTWYLPLIVAGLPLLVAAVLLVALFNGKPLSGIDQPIEGVYVTSCLAVLAGWSASAAWNWWYLALALVTVAWLVTCTWVAAAPGGLPTWAGGVIGAGAAVSVALVVGPVQSWAHWPLLWLLGTPAMCLPLWYARRVRRGVNVDKEIKGWPNRKQRERAVHRTFDSIILAAQERFDGMALSTVTAAPTMATAVVKLPGGTTLTQLEDALRWLESAAGLRVNSLTSAPDHKGRANYAKLQYVESDPHSTTQEWVPPTSDTIKTPLDDGPREDGSRGVVELWTPHGAQNGLIGGMKGVGKSTFLNNLIATLSCLKNALSIGIDVKGHGIELGAWARYGAMPYVARTIAQARAVYTALMAITQGRGVLLEREGKKLWDADRGPHIVLVCDEMAQVQGQDAYVSALTLSLAQLSRFALVSQVLATQAPGRDSIGDAAIRGQCDIRVAFRHGREPEAMFTLEGTTGYGDLPVGKWHNRRGTHLLVSGTEKDSLPVRSAQVPEEQITELAIARGTDPIALDEASYREALKALSTIIEERAWDMKEEEREELDIATREVLRAMAYPTPYEPASTPPASANVSANTELADPPADPVGAALAEGSASVTKELAEPVALTPEELAAMRRPEGVDEETFVETMQALQAELNRAADGAYEMEPIERTPDSSATDCDEFRVLRSERESAREFALERAKTPEGVTRKDVMRHTGRERTYAQGIITGLRDEGLLAPSDKRQGAWAAVLAPAAAPTASDQLADRE